MAKKKDDLLKKLSALKPSTPTRTRGGKAAGRTGRPEQTEREKPLAKNSTAETTTKAQAAPAKARKTKSAPAAAGKENPAIPGKRKKAPAPPKPEVPTARKKAAASAVPAAKAAKTGKVAGPSGRRPEKAHPEAALPPEKTVPEAPRPLEGKQPPPAGERADAPAAESWSAWRVGFFQAMPGVGCGALGDASGAACREAARLQKFWVDGWLRCTRIWMDVLDLNMKVILGFGRPWTGGR
jgi:hypothetical protein